MRTRESGVTLIEMLVVVVLIALLAGLTFPAVTAGVDTLRLNGSAQSTVSFLNAGLNRAERRQQAMELTISKPENALILRSVEAGFVRRLDLTDGVTIIAVHPSMYGEMDGVRSFMLYPGGTPPRIGIELANRKGDRRMVSVDPVTGVPVIERPNQGNK